MWTITTCGSCTARNGPYLKDAPVAASIAGSVRKSMTRRDHAPGTTATPAGRRTTNIESAAERARCGTNRPGSLPIRGDDVQARA